MAWRAGEGSTYMLEVASFDGTGQCIDAEAPQQDLGGESGLTVMSWVRRARNGGLSRAQVMGAPSSGLSGTTHRPDHRRLSRFRGHSNL